MSAGTRSSAMTATAPASAAMTACSGLTTSMMTPPFCISGKPVLTRMVPLSYMAAMLAIAPRPFAGSRHVLGRGALFVVHVHDRILAFRAVLRRRLGALIRVRRRLLGVRLGGLGLLVLLLVDGEHVRRRGGHVLPLAVVE